MKIIKMMCTVSFLFYGCINGNSSENNSDNMIDNSEVFEYECFECLTDSC